MNERLWPADHPVFLIGFMAAGKTTVGRLVALEMGWSFRDLDEVICERAGLSVSQIFSAEGEAGFRIRESRAIGEAASWLRTVVATGGGAACHEPNLASMLAAGEVIALDVAPEEVVRRAGSLASRPLLAGAADPLRIAAERLALREPFYRRAHHRIDTNGRTPEQVAADVVWMLEHRSG